MARRKRIKVVLSENIVLSENSSVSFELVNNEEYDIPDRLRMVEYEVAHGRNIRVKDIIESSFEDMPWFANDRYGILISVEHLGE